LKYLQNSLVKNVSWLFVVQITNQILPLFTIPYLSRMLGLEIYGVLALCVSICALASVLTDFGFDLWATSEIALRRDDVPYIGKLMTSIFIIKSLLLTVAFGAVILFSLFTKKYAAYSHEILLVALPLISITFTPTWFFQGLERMEFVAVPSLIAKLAYIVAVLLLVNGPDDLSTIIGAMAATQALVVATSVIALHRFGYAFRRTNRAAVVTVFRNATAFFWSRAAVATYTSGGALFVGLLASPQQLGIYATAEQLYRGLQSIASPLSQAIYPKMVREKDFLFLYRIVIGVALVSIAGALTGIALSPFIVHIVFGPQFAGASVILNVFFVTFVVSTTSSLLGYPLFGALNRLALANKSVFVAAASQLGLLSCLYYFELTSAFSVAMSVLLVELVVLLIRLFWAAKLGPRFRLR